jgi:hypothetical protein
MKTQYTYLFYVELAFQNYLPVARSRCGGGGTGSL